MGLDVFPPPLLVSATLGTVCGADHAFAVALMLSCCMQRKRVLKVTVMRSLRVLTADFFIRAPAFSRTCYQTGAGRRSQCVSAGTGAV